MKNSREATAPVESVWATTSQVAPTLPALEAKVRIDVAIIGGGSVPLLSSFGRESLSQRHLRTIADLEGSFREFVDVLLPKLLDKSLSPTQLNDVLLDMREELRHILYHIKDPEFFGYLNELTLLDPQKPTGHATEHAMILQNHTIKFAKLSPDLDSFRR